MKEQDYDKISSEKQLKKFMDQKTEKVVDYYTKVIQEKPGMGFVTLYWRSVFYKNDSQFKLSLKDIDLMSQLDKLCN